jgi:hypothetical protein
MGLGYWPGLELGWAVGPGWNGVGLWARAAMGLGYWPDAEWTGPSALPLMLLHDPGPLAQAGNGLGLWPGLQLGWAVGPAWNGVGPLAQAENGLGLWPGLQWGWSVGPGCNGVGPLARAAMGSGRWPGLELGWAVGPGWNGVGPLARAAMGLGRINHTFLKKFFSQAHRVSNRGHGAKHLVRSVSSVAGAPCPR